MFQKILISSSCNLVQIDQQLEFNSTELRSRLKPENSVFQNILISSSCNLVQIDQRLEFNSTELRSNLKPENSCCFLI